MLGVPYIACKGDLTGPAGPVFRDARSGIKTAVGPSWRLVTVIVVFGLVLAAILFLLVAPTIWHS